MRTSFRKTGAIALAVAGLTVAAATPASATGQDGLVNVNTGDITILKDVDVTAVAPIVTQLCSIDLSVPANVAALSEAFQEVDSTGKEHTVCWFFGSNLKLVQN